MARGPQAQQYNQAIGVNSGTGAIPALEQTAQEQQPQGMDVMFPKMGGPQPVGPEPRQPGVGQFGGQPPKARGPLQPRIGMRP